MAETLTKDSQIKEKNPQTNKTKAANREFKPAMIAAITHTKSPTGSP